MKNLLILINLFLIITIKAQTPQIALVKPDGTTSLHSTLLSVVQAAADDDMVYIPGGIFEVSNISKKLHIYGAGSIQDSCTATGKTKLYGVNGLRFYEGSDGSTLEGVEMDNHSKVQIGDNNITINRCYLGFGIEIIDTVSNIAIVNNIIQSSYNLGPSIQASNSGLIENSLISNNIILNELIGGKYNIVNNNLIFDRGSNFKLFGFSTYNNNIFKYGDLSVGSSTFNNCTNISSFNRIGNEQFNTIAETFPEIFVDPGEDPYGFSLENDYHVLPTSQCHNSGTDVTDRGIYGGTYPWKEGMVPSNPHIFFKNISDVTNSNGNLPINVKVKAQNN